MIQFQMVRETVSDGLRLSEIVEDILPPSQVVLQHFHGVWRGSVLSYKAGHPGQILLVDQDHRVLREVVLDDLEGALEEGHPGDEVVLLL